MGNDNSTAVDARDRRRQRRALTYEARASIGVGGSSSSPSGEQQSAVAIEPLPLDRHEELRRRRAEQCSRLLREQRTKYYCRVGTADAGIATSSGGGGGGGGVVVGSIRVGTTTSAVSSSSVASAAHSSSSLSFPPFESARAVDAATMMTLGAPRSSAWPDAWAALLVRCRAIAPFGDAADADPLSTSDFVSFMITSIQQQQQRTNERPPPPTSSSTHQQQQDDDDGGSGAWLVVDTPESVVPQVAADAPWPLEECPVCLALFSTGLNHCGRCHPGVCSRCLLQLAKPAVIGISTEDARMRAAIIARDALLHTIGSIIAGAEEALTLRHRRRHRRRSSLSASSGPDAMSSLSNFARLAVDAVQSFAKSVEASLDGKGRSGAANSAGCNVGRDSDEIDDDGDESAAAEIEHCKALFDLVRRVEVLSMFAASAHADRAAATSGSGGGGRRPSQRGDGDSGDDGDRSAAADESHAWLVCASGGDPGNDFDDCSDQQQQLRQASSSTTLLSLLPPSDRCCVAIQRALRVASRGTCPMCNASNARWYCCGRTLRTHMLIDLCSNVGCDDRVMRLLSSGGGAGAGAGAASSSSASTMASMGAGGSRPAVGAQSSSSSSAAAAAAAAWVAPTAAEAHEYELCIALALSAMAAAVVDGAAADAAAADVAMASLGWATLCGVCGNANWKEHACRVCGMPRS